MVHIGPLEHLYCDFDVHRENDLDRASMQNKAPGVPTVQISS